MSGGAAIVRGDALAIPLGDSSVDCIITSPPYFAMRSYSDGGEHYEGQIGSEATPQAFLEALWAVTAECWRVLKPTGSLFVNLGDKYEAKSLLGLPWRYAIGCADGMADPDGRGWVLRQEIVWSKPNGLPEPVKDRARRNHEHWFHMTRSGTYCADMDVLRVKTQGRPGLTWAERKALDDGQNGRARYSRDNGHGGSGGMADHPLGKLPDSVWSIATQPLVVPEWLDVDHFAAFPTEWPRRLISAWCPPDGVVLDPFGGTGTTAMVARALGRYGVSMDLSADYLRLARWRIWQSGQAAKVADRTDRDNQGVLL